MQKPIPIQSLECFSSPVAKDSITGEPVVTFATRPDDSTPHGLGLNLPQAQRLLAHDPPHPAALRLQHTSRGLLTERPAAGDPPTVEKFRTNVAVDVLTDQEQAPQPSSPADSGQTTLQRSHRLQGVR